MVQISSSNAVQLQGFAIAPKGQTFLKVFYAHTIDAGDPRHTEDPANIYFDRVVREIWGDDTKVKKDTFDFVYAALDPAEEDDSADTQVIVNDRVGNVTEYRFTAQNVNVRQREYTGRWDPDQPTFPADLANPTTPKLRDDDDPFFETRWEYNDDALSTRVIHPNGNEEVTIFDEGNDSRRSQGNASERCRYPGKNCDMPGYPSCGDQEQICELFEYDDGFGGCCGSNFVTEHTDARGNTTVHEYDDFGNRTKTTHRIPSIVEDMEYNQYGQITVHILPDNGSGHRRRDEFTYYDSGPQLGYLHEKNVDAPKPNFALTTVFEYNLVGQVNRTIDPRGNDTLFVVNQLDQVVRTISREVTEGGGVRYERDTFYDPNDNIVRVDVQNKDDVGVLQPNTHFTEVYEYEILNYRTRTCEEAGDYSGAIPGTQQIPLCTGLPGADFITTEYEYDANRNRTLTRYGEATNGNDPFNIVRTLYDERDLVFREVRAEGDADQSTTQYDYDNNRNTKRTSQGLEDVGAERITRYSYDGYDRLWGSDDKSPDDAASVDPMGNEMFYHYDENSNRISARTEGELTDVPGGADNERLSEGAYVYDEMDRQTRSEIEFFDTDTQGGIGDGQSIADTEYSDNSQVTRTVNDNLHQTLTTYDTANRVLTVTDAKGNIVKFETANGDSGYDANSNVIVVREI
ncbi:MAG: hypothetical protein IIB57_08670, partial [Planctomycetes bacterium]|nr:hypothetical protein [Planctomycetota bacterium]